MEQDFIVHIDGIKWPPLPHYYYFCILLPCYRRSTVAAAAGARERRCEARFANVGTRTATVADAPDSRQTTTLYFD